MNFRKTIFRRSSEAAATDWLARRDRGLTPREQDEYLQWLREDERHPADIARAEATMRRVLQLSAWRHAHSAEPNPDLLARARPRRPWLWPAAAAAAAAVLTLGLWWSPPKAEPTEEHHSYLRVNERTVLPDGTVAELRDGTRLDVSYTAAERCVRLIGGEAQFSVVKNPARPFIVVAAGVRVRAVGTVFTVQLGGESVAVLVTEGKVRVGAPAPAASAAGVAQAEEKLLVAAGQRTVVPLADTAAAPSVEDLSPEEIRRALEWQAPRLQFHETPLADAIAEFNRRNHRQLVLGEPALGAERIGGSFRPDNPDGFVRLLSVTLGVRAVPRGPDEVVLLPPK